MSNGITFMGADMLDSMPQDTFKNMSMALSGDNEAELTGYFEKLAVGGTIREPIKKAPWGDSFGMLVDKFGVEWMSNIGANKS